MPCWMGNAGAFTWKPLRPRRVGHRHGAAGQAEALLRQKLMGAAPANAEVELVVRPAAWDALDALAESWAAWEAKKLDWDAFDSGAGLQPEQNRKGGIYFADKP